MRARVHWDNGISNGRSAIHKCTYPLHLLLNEPPKKRNNNTRMTYLYCFCMKNSPNLMQVRSLSNNNNNLLLISLFSRFLGGLPTDHGNTFS